MHATFSNIHDVLPKDILINNDVVSQTTSVKFLGLHIDNKLSWRTHIHVDYLCKIISRNIGIINRLKLYLPQHILFSVYTTLISSYINYGILAWGNAAQTILNRLFLLQKKALRIITKSSFIAHTDPLFFHNKIL